MSTTIYNIKPTTILLKDTYPELIKEWHPTKNKGIDPYKIASKSDKDIWWKCKLGHEWKTSLHKRFQSNPDVPSECPYCSGKLILTGFNDLATLYPDIAKEWNYKRNGNIVPEKISPYSHSKVWWTVHHKDPSTGKTFDFEWESVIRSRTQITDGCPFLSGKRVYAGYNDLATIYPDIAKEWNYEKNKGLMDKNGNDISTPDKISANSKQTVWWKLSYDVPDDYPIEHLHGKHFDFEWDASICDRVSKKLGCPYLSGKRVWPGFNDLATLYPNIAKEWDYERNAYIINKMGTDISSPEKVTSSSKQDVWWICPEGHNYHAVIGRRTKNGTNCPICANNKVLKGFNDFATTHPEMAMQWHPTKNGNLKPDMLTHGSGQTVWWQCENGHEWHTKLCSRTADNTGCPYCNSHINQTVNLRTGYKYDKITHIQDNYFAVEYKNHTMIMTYEQITKKNQLDKDKT